VPDPEKAGRRLIQVACNFADKIMLGTNRLDGDPMIGRRENLVIAI
jgi:hypothetical protein